MDTTKWDRVSFSQSLSEFYFSNLIVRFLQLLFIPYLLLIDEDDDDDDDGVVFLS